MLVLVWVFYLFVWLRGLGFSRVQPDVIKSVWKQMLSNRGINYSALWVIWKVSQQVRMCTYSKQRCPCFFFSFFPPIVLGCTFVMKRSLKINRWQFLFIFIGFGKLSGMQITCDTNINVCETDRSSERRVLKQQQMRWLVEGELGRLDSECFHCWLSK